MAWLLAGAVVAWVIGSATSLGAAEPFDGQKWDGGTWPEMPSFYLVCWAGLVHWTCTQPLSYEAAVEALKPLGPQATLIGPMTLAQALTESALVAKRTSK